MIRSRYTLPMEVMRMEWLDRLNEALDYMEDNLDDEISFERAAQLACASVYHFQRMFSYIAGVPLSEYLRRRRLTKAALDLQRGDKVIDVALRYGYESPTAFNRAFQALHGLTPSAAQKPGAPLRAFPRIGFQLTIKGEAVMDYRIVTKDAFRIVGVRTALLVPSADGSSRVPMPHKADGQFKVTEAQIADSFTKVPAFWQEAGQRGQIAQICSMIGAEPVGLLGVTDCRGDEGSYYYIAAATDAPVPEGMYECIVPGCTWAVFPGEGLPGSIQGLQQRIFSEWLPTSGYEWDNAPDIEVYLNDSPTDMKYEVWLPIAKPKGA